MAEQDILAYIKDLVDAEHELRSQIEAGAADPSAASATLQRYEVTLDQCWDLLRQRRARIEQGAPAEDVRVSPPGQVEGYLQ